MKVLNFVLSVLFVLAITVAFILVAGNFLHSFLDPLSLLAMILFPLPPLIGIFGWKGFRGSIALAFRKDPAEPKEYERASEIVRSLGRLIYLAAALEFSIGFIGILSYADGTPTQLAAYLGIALISIFYGLLLNLVVVEPIRVYLKSRSVA